MNTMGFSAPITNSLVIIDFQPVKTFIGIKPTSLSATWANSPDIITFKPVLKNQVLTH